jgi:hypothetical protein
MRTLSALIVAACMLLSAPSAHAQGTAAPPPDEAALARELADESEKLEALRRGLGSDSELTREQERKVMELRARLSAVMARELARRALDPQRWRHSLEELRNLLRDRMRPWLEPEREQRPLPPGVWRA